MIRHRQHAFLEFLLILLFAPVFAAVGAVPSPDSEPSALPAAPENGSQLLEQQVLDLNGILIAKEKELASARAQVREAHSEAGKALRAAAAESAALMDRLKDSGKTISELRAACTSLVGEVAVALETGTLERRDAREITRDFPESADGVARIRELLVRHSERFEGRDGETLSLRNQLEALGAAVRRGDERIRSLEQELDAARKALPQAVASAKAQADARAAQKAEVSARLKQEITDLNVSLKESQASANSLQRLLEEKDRERARDTAAMLEKENELLQVKQQTTVLNRQLVEERAKSIAEQERLMDDADKRIAAIAAERDAAKKQLADSTASFPDKDRKIQSLSKQMEFTQREVLELREAVRHKDEELKAAGHESADATEKDAEIEGLKSQLALSAELQSQLRRELARIRATAASAPAATGDEIGKMMALEGAPLPGPQDNRKAGKVSELLEKTRKEVKDAPPNEVP